MKKHLFLTSLAAILATTAAGAVEIEDVVANAKLAEASMPTTSEPQYSDDAYNYDSNGDGTKNASLTNANKTDAIDPNNEAFTYQNRKGDWANLTLETAAGTAQADTPIDANEYYYQSTVANTTYYGNDEHINKSLYKYDVTNNEGVTSETDLEATSAISKESYTYEVNAEFTQRTTPQTIEHEPVFADYVGLDATLAGKTLADYMLADGSDIDSSKLTGLDSAAQLSIQNAYAAYQADHGKYEIAKGYYDASKAEFDAITEKADKDEAVVTGMHGVFAADSEDYDAKLTAYNAAKDSLSAAQTAYEDASTTYASAVANANAYNSSLSKVIKDADKVTLDSANAYTDTAVSGKANTTDVNEALALKADAASLEGKADKATTLAGYGIKDAYTIGQVDGLIANEAAAREQGDELTLTKANTYTDNVAAGLRGEFASNNALTLSKANAYTDSKVNKLEKDMSGGVAAATALSAVSVSGVNKGEVSVGGGYGYYNGQSAMAFGAAMGLSDRWSINAGAGLASGDSTQFSIRAGTNYKFKLF